MLFAKGGALLEAYMFYEIKRYDVKGKAELKTLGKYYIVDTGLRNYLLVYRDMDTGHIIENIVYFELLRRGFDVAIGKVGEKEILFIAKWDTESQYRVGNSYFLGRGGEKDPVVAVEWWRKAAEQGHAKAGHNLGTAYYHGDDVPMDKEEAAKWLKI